MGHERRRSRQRDLEVHRRRRRPGRSSRTGIPAGPKGRIGLDIYRRNPNILYARIEHDDRERRLSLRRRRRELAQAERPSIRGRCTSARSAIDPQTDSRIYVSASQLHVSDDGGKTFRADGAERIHVDHHAIWIDPANPNHVMIGNDGGVSISHDRRRQLGVAAEHPRRAGLSRQFDMQTPYHVCGGLQDNNTWCGPSAVRSSSGITNDDWYMISGGDGFQPLDGPDRRDIVYSESQDGRMSRIDRRTNERTTVRPEPAGAEAVRDDGPYRFNWDTAMQLSPFDPATIYIGANIVLKSSDRGRSYQPISPDLTTNTDRETLSIMGVVGKDIKIAKHDGVGIVRQHRHARGIAAKQGRRRLGRQRRRRGQRDAGRGQDLDQRDVEDVRRAEVDLRLRRAAVARRGRHRLRDVRRPPRRRLQHLRLRDHRLRRDVEVDRRQPAEGRGGPRRSPRIARTRTCCISAPRPACACRWNRGGQWTRIKANLPTMPIYEIKLHPRDNDMILATHARGIWILDDLDADPAVGEERDGGDAFAFEPEPVADLQHRQRSDEGLRGRPRCSSGMNPAPGATLAYRLKTDAKDVKSTIT